MSAQTQRSDGLFKTSDLTQAEEAVMIFLKQNAGIEYSVHDIEAHTGVRAAVIPRIMDNLRYKGHEACSDRGKHYWPKSSVLGWIIIIILSAALNWVFWRSLLGMLEQQ